MPDWKQIVRKNFRALEVCSPGLTEELAAHLEDSYEALLFEGLPAEVAFQHTIDQIEGRCTVWLVMRLLQEELMTGFIPKVALPGLLTSAAAGLLYWALALDHIRSKVIWLVGGQLPAVVVVPASDLRRTRSASLSAQWRIAASPHGGISVSECDPVHFGAAPLYRGIHSLGVSEPLPVSLYPCGIAGTSAPRIRVNTGGFFAAGRWNRRS